ncbi:MAG: ribonuclease Y [Oscillospiraceae bacterium]|nr:ribonuclease Y [Oscillospiraceae bacterium]MBQ2741449.1 ribonuclease Y [Oscillospiraceae bacterium]MBQ3224783.1 ribonuclease Y [Oscillospiraceae bacterium]MBQ4316239.1 ribonuclease Y [Oscillospiraceae bacterium]
MNFSELSPIAWIVIAAVVAVFAVVAFILGISFRKKTAEKAISGAENEAKRIVNDSIKTAESKKREMLIEAKEEIHKSRTEFDREMKDRRAELQKQERRVVQREESLDKKHEAVEQKDAALTKKIKDNDALNEELKLIKRSQLEMLEKISGYTVEEAKQYLIQNLESEVRHDYAVRLKDLEAQFKDEADEKARHLISLAIQKCAADHVAEATVSVVPLPNDEMKGRIIGREGRNIRALETLTGVDLIIDDTPEAITLSSFDPIRREVARISLEKLIADGRIHPARIEEMVEKARRDVDHVIKQEGERATFDTGVHGLNPEIIKLLGRLRFRTSYGQNVLKHSIEVAHIAGLLAAELGVDVMMAKRAGLLHDLGKSVDHEVEGSHVSIGVDLAKKYKESEEIIHAIHAHHGDVEPRTVIACIVQAADAISAARPGARRENLENYIKRLEKLEEIATSFKGVESSYAIQAGREVRIIVKPDEVNDDELILLSRELAKKIESDLEYPGQIKVHLIRETRAIDYAK